MPDSKHRLPIPLLPVSHRMAGWSLRPEGSRFSRKSNHIERLNRELKRRSGVIGIFPNEDSLIRLMGSVLMEQNSISQARKAIFSKESYQKLLRSDVRIHLHLIAEEQAALLAA